MTHEALHNEIHEARWLREYISTLEAALGATNGEATEAKATAALSQVDLAGELNFIFFKIRSRWPTSWSGRF